MKKKKTKINSFKNFMFALSRVYKIDKIYIFELIYITLSYVIVAFSYPYILTIVINGLEAQNDFITIMIKTIIIVVINLILTISRELIYKDIYSYRKNKISYVLTKEFYLRTFDLDYEKFEDTNTQDCIEKASRVVGSYGGIMQILDNSFDMISYILIFLISSTIIFTVNGWLVILIFGLSIIKLLLEDYRQKRYKKDFRDKTPNIWRRIAYANNISRNLSIGKDLRIYEMNKFIAKERTKETNKILKLKKQHSKIHILIYMVINVIKSLDEILLYGFMIYEVINNNMELGIFSFMIIAVRKIISSLNQIIKKNSNIVDCSLQINDYLEYIKQDLMYKKGTKFIEKELVEIEFQNVYYSYLGQNGYALEDISFKITKGERISLVGFNGAGKTTLIKLLCGFYHPTKGKILINGIDIETIDRRSLLEIFAPVFQDIDMFAISVLENVSMLHKEDTKLSKVYEALETSGIIDKINTLTKKENTIITKEYDDLGIELSGGENQKLAIARAIYKKAPFIILDEPTSALDSIAEANIYQSLNQIINDSSAIFISHRLSSTRFCDRIILLEEGKIVEIGTHDELMSKDTFYKQMFNMQAEYYVGGNNNE